MLRRCAAPAERPRSTAELSRLVTEAVPAQASAFCRACDAVHVDNGLFSMVGLAVAWVRASGLDDERYVRPDLWLDQSDPPVQADAAARLLAWHLRAHSPTTPAELAAYLAIGRVEAEQRWEQAPELAEVEHGG